MTDVHLINHTHWDREWFLTEEYTTAWIPALIDSLEDLASSNRDYSYLFDGQTLVIEDLLRIRPDYLGRVRDLVTGGQLEIGPCYSQPDWRMVSGELHVRNLVYGMQDAERLGGTPGAAWLVDTFGHISQAPQLLTQAGLDAAYVWRGVPTMTPLFRWRGADGTELASIDLFGGYRNLYGVTRTLDIALERLVAEADKLAPSYGDMPVPLFDGYDLDTQPEDPFAVYRGLDVPDHIQLHESSPMTYARAVKDKLDSAPVIDGELISGKFGSTFPGSLSARTYLKVAHHDAERAIHRRIEPLSAIAIAAGVDVDLDRVERASRELLQNGVHDCLCGVSIDQVHERMERSYRTMLAWANDEQQRLAAAFMPRFGDGTHAVCTTAMDIDTTVRADGHAMRVSGRGIGVSAVKEVSAVDRIDADLDEFTWSNDHYSATVNGEGIAVAGAGQLARIVVRRDAGDTYSSEPGEVLGELELQGSPRQLDASEIDATVRTTWQFQSKDINVEAEIDVRFDDTALIDLAVRLDSTGVGFRVDAHFETGIRASTVHASMPFDVVERPHEDLDLFEREIDPELAAILMGQRETGYVTEFPFHDFVALTDGAATRAVLAHGLRGYHTSADGSIGVALRRSVEWLALTDLQLRSGDAGPAMYVPGARSERRVEHRLGFAVAAGGVDSIVAINEAFHHPPVIVDVQGTGTPATNWTATRAQIATTGFVPNGEADGATLRLINTTTTSRTLPAGMTAQTIRGEVHPAVDVVPGTGVGPRVLVSTEVPLPAMPSAPSSSADVRVLTPIVNRVGPSRSKPDPVELQKLEDRISYLEEQLIENATAREAAQPGTEAHRLEHYEYVLDRERLELTLSLELNRRRLNTDDEVSIPDDPDPVIASIGADLNDLRIKRRIWDYVVQALG